MSYKKAMAAGAKQQARTALAAANAKSSNVHKSVGGKCSMGGCGSPATRHIKGKNFCRDCAKDLGY